MPFQEAPPYIVQPSLESEPIKFANQDFSAGYALSVVNETYWSYELFRYQNHDRRWNSNDALYTTWVPPKVWDGSNTARASLGLATTFGAVEAALPAICQALFGVGKNWFDVDAEPGTDPAEAQQQQDALSYVVEHPKDDLGSNARRDIELAIKSLLMYGNGVLNVEWNAVWQRPSINWVDIRDIYIDPGLTTPELEDSRSVVYRQFLTIDELNRLKQDPRMDIPSNEILWYMAQNVPQAPAEQTKRVQEAIRGIYFSPGFSDFLPLPSDRKIEVLVYYSKSRIIWILNKQWVAFNGPNPYNFIPFVSAPCFIFTSRYYAMSLPDVLENPQRYAEALINGRLDEISLAIHPPRVQNRGLIMTPQQQKWKPGAIYQANNKDDITLLQPQQSMLNIYTELEFMDQQAEKLVGINGVSQGTVPRPSNANRTAGGMQMMASGSSTRLSYIVGNIEQYMLVPLLYKLQKLIQMHVRPGMSMPAAGKQGDYYYINSEVMQKKVRFRMNAASKMLTKDKLMQVFPFIMQFIAQGPFMEQLGKVGKTVDFEILFQMLEDATGVSDKYRLVRTLSQDEQKAAQQPPPDVAAKQQQAQSEQQTRLQLMDKKVAGQAQAEQIKKQPNQWEIQAAQQKAQLDQQQKQQEMMMDQASQQAELKAQMIMQQIKIQAQAQKHQLDIQKAQADHQVKMSGHAMEIQQQQDQMLFDRQNAAVQDQTAQDFPNSDRGGGPPVRQPAGGQNDTSRSQRPQRREPRSKAKAPTA